MSGGTEKLSLVFDVHQMRPACVLLQAAYGCGCRPRALDFFDSDSWLVAPTDGMVVMKGTEDEWRQIAAKTADTMLAQRAEKEKEDA